jgi:hypothetical protein
MQALRMILAIAYVLCLLSVPLARGRLTALADVELKRPGLAVAAIVLQILIVSVLPGSLGAAAEPLHVGTYLLLGAFAWANRRLAGVPIVALGGGLNFLAIAVNGGVMPADPDALAAAGLSVQEGEFSNSAHVADAKLAFLGDIIPTPDFLPVSNVYSVGDLLLVLGVFVLLHVACGSRLVPRRRRAPRPAPAA